MKSPSFLLVLALLFNSCSKPIELQIYKDQKYPITIKYTPKTMNVDAHLNEQQQIYWINLSVNLLDEFPDDAASEANHHLYQVVIFQNLKGFSESDGGRIGDGSLVAKETVLNGTPVIAISDDKGALLHYTLLVPGVYAEIWFSGMDVRYGNPSMSEAFANRLKEYTYEMIKHFRWTQPIDTNSAEFKAWKAHIWEILKASPASIPASK